MSEVFLAAAFLAVALLAFVAAIRLGMLLGRRLDRSMQAREMTTASEERTDTGGQPRE